jgi:hypothetical protein
MAHLGFARIATAGDAIEMSPTLAPARLSSAGHGYDSLALAATAR